MFSGVEKGCIGSEWVKTDKFWDVDIDNKLVPFKYAATKNDFRKSSVLLWIVEYYENFLTGMN